MPAPIDLRVLLVDHDAAALERFRTLAQREPWELAHASSVGEAVEKAGHHPVDVIVTDNRLADGDGRELILRLRAHELRVPVVIVTDERRPGLADTLLDAGAADVLSKSGASDDRLVNATAMAVWRARVEERFRRLREREDRRRPALVRRSKGPLPEE